MLLQRCTVHVLATVFRRILTLAFRVTATVERKQFVARRGGFNCAPQLPGHVLCTQLKPDCTLY